MYFPFLLALGWSKNIKKKYIGDGVKCGFKLMLLLVVVLQVCVFIPIIPHPFFFVMCR